MTDYILGDENGLVLGFSHNANIPSTLALVKDVTVMDWETVNSEKDATKRRNLYKNPPFKTITITVPPVCSRFISINLFGSIEEIAIGEQLPFPRDKRNQLLSNCDYWDLPNFRKNKNLDVLDAWDNYRQSLRDLPSNTADNWNIVWPVSPQ